MEKFRPSNRVPLPSFIMLLIFTIVGGAIIGGVVAFVGQYFYLVFAFPIIMAAAGGGLLGIVVKVSKVRSPFIAVLFGILMAAVIYGVYQYGDYYLTRQKAVAQIATDNGVTVAEADTAFETGLKKLYGTGGFVGYIQFVVNEVGLQFTSTSYGSTTSGGTPMKGTLVYLYWASEFLIILIGAAYYASVQARKPFCENCNAWYTGNARIGSVDRKSSKNLVQLLKNKQFAEAKAMFIPPTNPPRTDVEMNFCKTCQNSDVVVSAKRLVNTNRRRTSSSVLVKGVVTRQELTDLLPVATGNS